MFHVYPQDLNAVAEDVMREHVARLDSPKRRFVRRPFTQRDPPNTALIIEALERKLSNKPARDRQ